MPGININKSLDQILRKRKDDGLYRSLSAENKLVDFCSNDYLGFARSEELKNRIIREVQKYPDFSGSTGSRLITGNSKENTELENYIAGYHHAEAGLIFNSGYDANTGLLSSVPKKGDLILYDELAHASIRDGIRLSFAKSLSFHHNDIDHLTLLINNFYAGGHHQECFIVTESVFSMDGDFAPLKELASICEQYSANLIVDEAHATGIFGKGGRGRVSELGLEKMTFTRVHTFGKALGCFGAIILGSRMLINYLINFSRSFIYTTALPPVNIIAVQCTYEMLLHANDRTNEIFKLLTIFKNEIKKSGKVEVTDSESPIQAVLIKGNARVKEVARLIQKAGFDVRPILSPTVPEGKERLRISIHSFNTEKEIISLVDVLKRSIKETR